MSEDVEMPASFDPYHDKKTYHFAAKQDGKGNVSPLCANPPRALNLTKGQSWTLRWQDVTCKKCIKRRRP